MSSALAILAVVYILYRALKAWKQPAPQVIQPEPVAAPSDEYVARIEEELRRTVINSWKWMIPEETQAEVAARNPPLGGVSLFG